MKSINYLSAAALFAALVAGCASTPQPIPELAAARTEVQEANNDPLAQEAAGMRLKKADEALRVANESSDRRRPVEQIRQQAYLATRQAQIAKAQTAELRARKEIEQGQAERNQVLLDARTSEAALATADARRSRNDAERSRSDAATETAQANAETASARADAERSRSDAAVQTADAAAAREQLAVASDESVRLRTELEALHAKQTERGMVLTLGDVMFDTGRAVVRPSALRTVERLAEFLRHESSLNVMIEGHTDSVGGDEYNLDLSQRRADAVRAALVDHGIAADRVRTHGLGESYPSASNDSAGGRQQNRRVEIIFSDGAGQFSSAAERLSRS
jgi:outer membrane protein OmpA-like peptidoglycan-associated protein